MRIDLSSTPRLWSDSRATIVQLHACRTKKPSSFGDDDNPDIYKNLADLCYSTTKNLSKMATLVRNLWMFGDAKNKDRPTLKCCRLME